MYSLITFASAWGSKFGGINSFNTDFLKAFGVAFHHSVEITCFVDSASNTDIEDARNAFITLLEMDETAGPANKVKLATASLTEKHISFDPENTVWLGHDRITGSIAIEAAKQYGGRSALIHHMSYDAYESFAENSQTAYSKAQVQIQLFNKANLVLAIGPLLRDAAKDIVGNFKKVHMVIPGLAEEIVLRNSPKTFSAFMCGRLSPDATRIKQGHLGIAAFAHAHKLACENEMPESLFRQPKITIRGVDFEAEKISSAEDFTSEQELKTLAEKYADRAINLHALPYTLNREELYDNISRSSVVLMPSWHEGFGLTAWEAIAAGIPLVLSKQSGVYRLLEEEFAGTGTGCVHSINIRGSHTKPYFHTEDLNDVAEAIKRIALRPESERQKAINLRNLLINKYTWSSCAEQAAAAFSWELQKGIAPGIRIQPELIPTIDTSSQLDSNSIIKLPKNFRKNGTLMSDSQLLRAEEALVPFDPARKPDLDRLRAWSNNRNYQQSVRLITGEGGLGKTRLALHLCEQLLESGWHVGFLASGLLPKSIIEGWKLLKAFGKPLLIVIDYAETRQADLIALIKAMLEAPNTNLTKVLLLARDGGEWWDNLPSKDKICEPILSGYATDGPFRIPPLHDKIQDRRQAYQIAMQAFAESLGCGANDVTPDLSAEHFGRPLYLQMAALLALRGERPNSAQGLTRALLNHERRYWDGLLNESGIPEPTRYAEQLLALVTLSGEFTSAKDARLFWDQIDKGVLTAAQFNQLFDALRPLYPSKKGLEAVRPDLLGEALVAKTLQTSIAHLLLNATLGKTSTKSVRLHTLTVLARLSNNYFELKEVLSNAFANNFQYSWQEFLHVAKETPSDLPVYAQIGFINLATNIQSQLTGFLLNNMRPRESVQLAEFDCLVRGEVIKKLHNRNLHKLTDTTADELGTGLISYSVSLSFLDRKHEALEASNSALSIFQKLSNKNPDRFESALANTLTNSTGYLRSVGRNIEALEFAERALGIYQKLVRKNPQKYEADLTNSLNNYANRLSDSGRYEEAITYAKQVLEIRQRLFTKNPAQFEYKLASSLDNYAKHLFDLGHNEEGIKFAKQALDIYQRLANKNPDRFTEDWFSAICSYYFFKWLSNEPVDHQSLSIVHVVPNSISRHQESLLLLWSSFVRACYSSDFVTRSNLMGQVVSIWRSLSGSNQIMSDTHFVCAAAWCAQHNSSFIKDFNWQAQWLKLYKELKGNIPNWMLIVAEQLKFEWDIEVPLD